MPFLDIVEIMESWNERPTITMMLLAYFKIEDGGTEMKHQDLVEVSRVLAPLVPGGRAEKLSNAPKEDQARFAALNAKAKGKK